MRESFTAVQRLATLASVGLLAIACGSADEVTPAGSSTTGFITGAGGADATGPTSSSSWGATTSSASGGGAGGTADLGAPYPIVLAHGFFGFNDFAGAGFLTYYFEVKQTLEAQGVAVYTPSVDPFNSSEVRGAELVAQIEAIVAETGRAKVNLIGHSQGGLDARVVAHDRPDLVASVLTVATPHGGSPVADIALELVADPQLQGVIDAFVNVIGAPLYDQLGEASSVSLALAQFSEPGIAAFNATYSDAPGVPYWSVAGRTAYASGGSDCAADVHVPFIDDASGSYDPVDPLLAIFEGVLHGSVLDPIANDGLVRARDARWGTFLGCVPADHLDEVGQLFGDAPGLANPWDHAEFYADLVAFLRAQGL